MISNPMEILRWWKESNECTHALSSEHGIVAQHCGRPNLHGSIRARRNGLSERWQDRRLAIPSTSTYAPCTRQYQCWLEYRETDGPIPIFYPEDHSSFKRAMAIGVWAQRLVKNARQSCHRTPQNGTAQERGNLLDQS